MNEYKKSVHEMYCDFKKAFHELIDCANDKTTPLDVLYSTYSNFKKSHCDFTNKHTPGESTRKSLLSCNGTKIDVYRLFANLLHPEFCNKIKNKEKRIELMSKFSGYTEGELRAVVDLDLKALSNLCNYTANRDVIHQRAYTMSGHTMWGRKNLSIQCKGSHTMRAMESEAKARIPRQAGIFCRA